MVNNSNKPSFLSPSIVPGVRTASRMKGIESTYHPGAGKTSLVQEGPAWYTDMDINDYDIWWYMMIYDDIWWLWWYMMIYDDIWWYMMIYDDIWWYMMIMMIHEDIWWYMMIYDDIWWYMMIMMIKMIIPIYRYTIYHLPLASSIINHHNHHNSSSFISILTVIVKPIWYTLW